MISTRVVLDVSYRTISSGNTLTDNTRADRTAVSHEWQCNDRRWSAEDTSHV